MKMHKVWRVDANITFAARNLISRNAVWREPFMVIRWYALLNRHINRFNCHFEEGNDTLGVCGGVAGSRSLSLSPCSSCNKSQFSTSIIMTSITTNASVESFCKRKAFQSIIKAIRTKLLIFALVSFQIYIHQRLNEESGCIIIGFLHSYWNGVICIHGT